MHAALEGGGRGSAVAEGGDASLAERDHADWAQSRPSCLVAITIVMCVLWCD